MVSGEVKAISQEKANVYFSELTAKCISKQSIKQGTLQQELSAVMEKDARLTQQQREQLKGLLENYVEEIKQMVQWKQVPNELQEPSGNKFSKKEAFAKLYDSMVKVLVNYGCNVTKEQLSRRLAINLIANHGPAKGKLLWAWVPFYRETEMESDFNYLKQHIR